MSRALLIAELSFACGVTFSTGFFRAIQSSSLR